MVFSKLQRLFYSDTTRKGKRRKLKGQGVRREQPIFELTPLEQRVMLSGTDLSVDLTNSHFATWTDGGTAYTNTDIYNPLDYSNVQFHRGGTVTLALQNLPKHTSLTLNFDLITFNEWGYTNSYMAPPDNLYLHGDQVTITAADSIKTRYTAKNTYGAAWSLWDNSSHLQVGYVSKQSYPSPSAAGDVSLPDNGGIYPYPYDLDNDCLNNTGYMAPPGCITSIGDSVYHFSIPVNSATSTMTLTIQGPESGDQNLGATPPFPGTEYFGVAKASVDLIAPNPCPCQNRGQVDASDGASSSASGDNVDPSDGDVSDNTPGISSDGGDGYDSGVSIDDGESSTVSDGSVGNNAVLSGAPELIKDGSSTLYVRQGTTMYAYDSDGQVYRERVAGTNFITYDSVNDLYTLDPDGRQTVFYGFSSSTPGNVKSVLDPNGNTTTYTYNGTTHLLSEVTSTITDGTNTTYESFVYTYLPTGDANAGKLESILLRRSPNGSTWTPVTQTVYSYYGSSATGGNLGDLELVQNEDAGPVSPSLSLTTSGSLALAPQYYQVTAVLPAGESAPSTELTITPTSGNQTVSLSWSAVTGATAYKIYRGSSSGQEYYLGQTASTSYSDTGASTSGGQPPINGTNFYRYYAGESGGPTGALKYIFGPTSYVRLAAALTSGTPQNATDATYASTLQAYADSYYQYDSDGRVQIDMEQGQGGSTSGGVGEYQYAYDTNSGASGGYNAWTKKTTVTLPDGTMEVHYYNSQGQSMLDVLQQVAPAVSVSITHSTTTATVTLTGHGFKSGDVVYIQGAAQAAYNGRFTITVLSSSTFSYTMATDPGANASGTITCQKILQQWGTFTEYDSLGHKILKAQPSAVQLPANLNTLEQWSDLLHKVSGNYQYLSDTSGQINTLAYASNVGWTFTGNGGITSTGSSLLPSMTRPAHDGNQAAFLTDTASMTETITASNNLYYLHVWAALAAGSGSQTLDVYIDGVKQVPGTELGIGSSSFVDTTEVFGANFAISAGTHTLTLQGRNSGYTVLIDSVSFAPSGVTVPNASIESPAVLSGATVVSPLGSTATATTGGAVNGYFTGTYVQNGETGTAVPLETMDYFSRVTSTSSLFPVADDTDYGSTGSGDARTTSYSYTWNSGTTQMLSQTVTQPNIVSGQNGSGTADSQSTFYDTYGRPIWTLDGDGHVNYTAYDLATGAVIKSIVDVNYASLSGAEQTLFGATGWSHPSGLNLVTAYVVDNQGRVTQTTSPAGNITYTVYNDTNFETRVYPGWISTTGTATSSGSTTTIVCTSLTGATGAYVGQSIRVTAGTDAGQSSVITAYNASTHTLTFSPAFTTATTTSTVFVVAGTTGPIQVSREYRPAANTSANFDYTETLTSSAPANLSASGTPDGSETLSFSNIQSLRRDFLNPAGQIGWSDSYFNTSGLTYSQAVASSSGVPVDIGTSGTNFYRTSYGYDAYGRQNRVLSPTGTITRTVYDALGRVSSTWMGTTDTYSGSDWTPATNTGNMIDVTDNGYDQTHDFLAAPSAPSLSSTAGGSLTGATYYVVITYTGAGGETLASTESSQAVATNNLLVVTHPTSVTGATGYNIYVGTSPQTETLQASSSIGSNWTMPTTGMTTTGALAPQDIGDGNLTRATTHPGVGAADRVTEYLYDFRDRQVAEKVGELLSSGVPNPSGETDSAHRPIYYRVLDNQGETIRTYQFDGDTVPLADFVSVANTAAIPTADAGKVRALTVNSYDDLGRIYRTQMYDVDQTIGLTTNGTTNLSDAQILALANLSTDSFYDHRGDLIATFSPGGQVSKSAYDGAGRVTTQYITDGGATNNSGTQRMDWTNAGSVSNDVVLTQTENTYDSDGNVLLSTTRDRFDNDASSSTGGLGTPSTGVLARVSYIAMYYDAANRQTDSVNVGTNAGSSYTRPGSVPSRSDTVLVSHTDYDSAGRVLDTIDPRNIMTQYGYDQLGRQTTVTENSSGGSPPTGTTVTNYTYDGANHILTMTANTPSNSPTTQVTQYVYGVGGSSGTNLFSNDLIATVRYPDPSTGAASTSAANDVSYTYDLLGESLTMIDQNGTTHTYAYDVLGRNTSDTAVVASGNPQSVDTTILKHGYTYNALGLVEKATSYSTGTTVVNQTQYTYNGFGQLTGDYQAHSGTVTIGTTPGTQYIYTEAANGNNSRLRATVYPNTRILEDTYGGQMAVSSITHSGTTATATTAGPSGVLAGTKVTVSGASPSAYNGTFTVTGVSGNTFTYTMGSSPASNASGNEMLATVTPEMPITSITHSGTTATITLPSGFLSGLSNGTTFSVTIAGATATGGTNANVYNGTFTVTVASSTTLTYTTATTPGSNATGTDMSLKSSAVTLDDMISRVTTEEDMGGTSVGTVLEGYSYLGLDTIVVRNRPQPHQQLTYVQQTGDGSAITDAGDRYTGLDRFGRVLDQNWLNLTSTPTAADRFQYGYDRDGNVLYKKNLVSSSFSELYHANSATSGDNATAYDNVNRITGFRRGTLSASANNSGVLDTVTTLNSTLTANKSESWSLDAVGNWNSQTVDGTATTRAVNGRNEQTTVGANTLTFDNDGNTTKDQTGKFYSYDAWNQLIKMYDTNHTTVLVTASHDAVGRFITYNNGSATDWYYDGTRQVQANHASDYSQFVWGQGYVNAMILRDRNTDGNTGTGSYGDSGSGFEERVYVQQDANWNVTSIYNIGTSSIPERFVYDPYGNVTTLDGSWALFSDTTWFWSIKFQGAYYDGTGKFSIMGARTYSSALGRWMQQDPAGYVDSSNLYQFVNGDPIRICDSTGLQGGSNWHQDPNVIKNNDIAILNDKIKEWQADGYTFSIALLKAFLSQKPVKRDAFQDFYFGIKISHQFREAAQAYFSWQVDSGKFAEGDNRLPDNLHAFDVEYYGIFGPQGDLGNALGGAHFGYTDAVLTYHKYGEQGGYCWKINAKMHQIDTYDFPAGAFLSYRTWIPSYHAAYELEYGGFNYKNFTHEETWPDTFGGLVPIGD